MEAFFMQATAHTPYNCILAPLQFGETAAGSGMDHARRPEPDRDLAAGRVQSIAREPVRNPINKRKGGNLC